MAQATYNAHGIRFEYSVGWTLEEVEDGPRMTVTATAEDGLGFAFVALDTTPGIDPDALAQEALDALREEYPTLRSQPATSEIDGQASVGHAIEFDSLDIPNECVIHCRVTPNRAILYFAQWSTLADGDQRESDLALIQNTLQETG